MSATKERIEGVAAVILDKWDNGEASQVGSAEDWDLSDGDFEAALSMARRAWAEEERRYAEARADHKRGL